MHSLQTWQQPSIAAFGTCVLSLGQMIGSRPGSLLSVKPIFWWLSSFLRVESRLCYFPSCVCWCSLLPEVRRWAARLIIGLRLLVSVLSAHQWWSEKPSSISVQAYLDTPSVKKVHTTICYSYGPKIVPIEVDEMNLATDSLITSSKEKVIVVGVRPPIYLDSQPQEKSQILSQSQLTRFALYLPIDVPIICIVIRFQGTRNHLILITRNGMPPNTLEKTCWSSAFKVSQSLSQSLFHTCHTPSLLTFLSRKCTQLAIIQSGNLFILTT